MGLLGDSWEDPRTAAILNLAGGLLSQRNLGAGLVQGMQGYTSAMMAAKKAQQEEEERKQIQAQRALQARMLEAQFADQLRAREEAAAAKQARGSFLDSIDPNAGPAMPPTLVGAMRAGFSPQEAQTFLPPKPEAFTLKPGERRFVGNNVVAEVPAELPKPEAAPAAVREYEYARSQGYKGTFQQFDAERRRAGATNVSVPINTAKPLLNTMAEGLGKQIDNNLGAARSAVDTIGGAQRIRTLLDTGQVVTGPGADWRIAARQVGSVLGVGGKDNDEVLANTRKTMQQLAQFELDAAQSMKGQGAITESEREILRRAAAGMITFTQPELKALSTALEERARKRIRVHNQDVDRLGQMPEGAQLVPFYRVTEPGAGSAVDDIVNRYRSR